MTKPPKKATKPEVEVQLLKADGSPYRIHPANVRNPLLTLGAGCNAECAEVEAEQTIAIRAKVPRVLIFSSKPKEACIRLSFYQDGVKIKSSCIMDRKPWGKNTHKDWVCDGTTVYEEHSDTWTHLDTLKLVGTNEILADVATPVIDERNTEDDPVLGTVCVTVEQCKHDVKNPDLKEYDTGRVNGAISERVPFPQGQPFVMSLEGGRDVSKPAHLQDCERVKLISKHKIRLISSDHTAPIPSYSAMDPPSAPGFALQILGTRQAPPPPPAPAKDDPPVQVVKIDDDSDEPPEGPPTESTDLGEGTVHEDFSRMYDKNDKRFLAKSNSPVKRAAQPVTRDASVDSSLSTLDSEEFHQGFKRSFLEESAVDEDQESNPEAGGQEAPARSRQPTTRPNQTIHNTIEGRDQPPPKDREAAAGSDEWVQTEDESTFNGFSDNDDAESTEDDMEIETPGTDVVQPSRVRQLNLPENVSVTQVLNMLTRTHRGERQAHRGERLGFRQERQNLMRFLWTQHRPQNGGQTSPVKKRKRHQNVEMVETEDEEVRSARESMDRTTLDRGQDGDDDQNIQQEKPSPTAKRVKREKFER